MGGNINLYINPLQRIKMIVDENSFENWNIDKVIDCNPLEFIGYFEKIKELQNELGTEEAIIIGKAKLKGISTVIGVMDGRFIMGSMGRYVGEALTYAFERACKERLPIILFCCSGGARIQEGIYSLMQMVKVSSAIEKYDKEGLLYISVLLSPTMGGVTASVGMLGDIIMAEPGALIGFTGPNVIWNTIHEETPIDFQTAEYQFAHGFLDMIVSRENQRKTLISLLELHKHICKHQLNYRCMKKSKSINSIKSSTAWERVKIVRSQSRPSSSMYICELMHDFIELSGDRCWGNDAAIIGGIAKFHEIPVTVVGIERNRESMDKALQCNFGMPRPEGYKKSLRLMKQAEKFGRPIICFIDTPGAYPGIEAEERGQGAVIAQSLKEISVIRVPILSIIVGEGYSGGALALAVADEIWMLSNAVFSVASPESFATILWKNTDNLEEKTNEMKLTAEELLKMRVIDNIIEEDPTVTIKSMSKICKVLDAEIYNFLKKHMKMSRRKLLKNRYAKYRKY